jgi:hypothetical protein
MKKSEFPDVENFAPNPPRMPITLGNIIWSCLFMLDFTFGLTTKPDGEGDVVKKTKYPGKTGRLYNRAYARLFKDVEKHFGHLALKDPTPVPSVAAENWDHAKFARWRKTANSPLVIKGLLKNSRAVNEWSKAWMVEHHGDAPTRCLDTTTSPDRRDKSMVGENVTLHDISLRDFLLKDQFSQFYVNNFHGVFSDSDFAEYCDGEKINQLRGAKYTVVQWFISRAMGTGTPLHCANADNLFLNIKGRKEWHFFHPALTPVMLPALSKFAVYAVSEIGEFTPEKYAERYQAFPHVAKMPKMIYVLEEGDVLYNPPWWWHNVQNRSSFNVGCATRYIAHPINVRNAPQFQICQFVDAIKHPVQSLYPQGLLMRFFKRDRSRLIDSIFSKKDRPR